jgi:hypothetical protein
MFHVEHNRQCSCWFCDFFVGVGLEWLGGFVDASYVTRGVCGVQRP